ncbi:unnamed protein product [Calypogeia fissa]
MRGNVTGPSPAPLSAPLPTMGSLLEDNKHGTSHGTSPAPKKKICCACPDTKRLRDECVVAHGEDACGKWIDAHKMCLRAEGFKV